MKKITSKETFTFKVNKLIEIDISPKGVIVDEDIAKIVFDRYGALVTITDAKHSESLKEVTIEAPKVEEKKEQEVI